MYQYNISNDCLKKTSGTVDFYSGREVADWPVEWWGGWLGLHRDSAAVTPSHHCQMSSVYKTGQLCNDKGWCETETHSILNVHAYGYLFMDMFTFIHLTGSRRSSNISHAFSKSSGDNNWKCTKEICLFNGTAKHA